LTASDQSLTFSLDKDQVVFRPTGFADLAGKRVGIFGYGVEGRATKRRLIDVAQSLVLVDDAHGLDDVLATSDGGLDALKRCDVVLKSPGIPRRRSDVLDLERSGVVVTSALNLWLHDVERSRVVAITGTKGKSTTTALVTFFLQCVGESAVRLGNIGQPPYDPDIDTSRGWLVLEVSSFQCVDIDVAPGHILVTSLGEDHIDWHGGVDEYRNDKLSLTRAPGVHQTLVPESPLFHELAHQLGGTVSYVAPDSSPLAELLGLQGAHSHSNVAMALRCVESLTGLDPSDLHERVAAEASTFEPLPGRLTLIATERVNGATWRFIDDGLATSVLPTIAALEVFRDDDLALIAGGFDRGVDYEPLASALGVRTAQTFLVSIGDAGQRVGEALARLRPDITQAHVSTMRAAVEVARASLPTGGVVLLSPAAPSFDLYQNWEERSADFTRIVAETKHV
jgi:UDP-N-acetylmuramoylalanine--D-glutamate ligase